MGSLKPFWRYYGGKWRAAPRYPKPRTGVIVEPFAGAAGYALRYPHLAVTLIERYAVVAEVWRYLISVSATEVRGIPLVENVDDLPSWVPRGARWLIGFTLNSGVTSPRNVLSAGCRRLNERGANYGWSEMQRERVASQVDSIRHWRVIEGDYTEAEDVEATWFVDPPYQIAGSHYVHGSSGLDYTDLASWCLSRRGQVIVCENEGATWLPFRPFEKMRKAMRSRGSTEAVWTSEALP